MSSYTIMLFIRPHGWTHLWMMIYINFLVICWVGIGLSIYSATRMNASMDLFQHPITYDIYKIYRALYTCFFFGIIKEFPTETLWIPYNILGSYRPIDLFWHMSTHVYGPIGTPKMIYIKFIEPCIQISFSELLKSFQRRLCEYHIIYWVRIGL